MAHAEVVAEFVGHDLHRQDDRDLQF
jgi:hypothetical protein